MGGRMRRELNVLDVRLNAQTSSSVVQLSRPVRMLSSRLIATRIVSRTICTSATPSFTLNSVTTRSQTRSYTRPQQLLHPTVGFAHRNIMSQATSAAPASAAASSPSTSTSGTSPRPLRILCTFALPPPSLSLFQNHPSYPGVPLDIRTCQGEMENAERLREQVRKHAPIDGIICRPGNTVDRETLELCGPNLKAISTFSVGHNHIDREWARERGILVGYCPDTVTHCTADLCLTLMLSVSRLVIPAHENVQSGQWGAEPFHVYHLAGKDLHHSTVGIVGLGRIGLAVAKRLRGFECKILYSGRREKPEAAKQVDAEYVSFEELLKRSDFVVPQCPLDSSTRHLFNESAFRQMKPSAIFVNTTRGGVVDQEALAKALKEGWIWGAGLDVTEPEPLPQDSPLLGLKNCLVLPHVGTATAQCRHETAEQMIENLMEALTKEGGGKGVYCNR
jgi:lactate dehydrogenase-like 2-hydroxyacid dehydrogenase